MATQVVTKPKPPLREIKPITQQVLTLSSPTAQTFQHIHPVLLSTYFYLRFPSLVTDPVSALTTDLFAIAAIQCAYATLCLPVSKRISAPDPQSTSSSSSSTVPSRSSKPSKARGPKASASSNDTSPAIRITNALLSLLLTALASPPTYLLLVLFGAPITTHHPHTFLTAAHFALLAFFPLFYAHGINKRAWWEIGGAMLPFDGVWGASVGTALGAWLGAVPIPLDWDRDWQKWPITIVAGMYGGAIVGSLAGRWLLRGKRMEFSPPPKDE